jgi:amino acid transporter
MFRDFIRRLNKTFFWISKWIVAAVVLALLLVVAVILVLRQDIDFDTFLNYFALGLLIFVVITLFYGIIAIHDVPYELAHRRNHPHQDAIHAAGWVSLFTLHALWPFLWIWAMLYRPDRGWGFQQATTGVETTTQQGDKLEELLRRVEALEARSGGAVLRRQTPIIDQPPALKIVDPQ